MRAIAVTLGVVTSFVGVTPALAQWDPVRTHIEFVADRYFDTPDGRGLLPTAVAEAELASEYASRARGDAMNLAGMRRNAGYVLHAVDPGTIPSGPGLGYGVRSAAAGVRREIDLALAYDSVTDNIRLHGRHVANAMSNVVSRTDQVIVLASQVRSATSRGDAARLVERLVRAVEALLRGVDGNGDGLRGWPDGDEGLTQAAQHMTLMKRGEGWSG